MFLTLPCPVDIKWFYWWYLCKATKTGHLQAVNVFLLLL